MPYFYFIWTAAKVRHLAENGVTAQEFEDVVNWPVEHIISRTTGRPGVIGYTRAGRRLVAFYERIDEATLEPVMAYDDESR